MANLDQIPFGAPEFVENPEPRCPCLLLLDMSHSMQGQPISELNNGLVAVKDELTADALAMKRNFRKNRSEIKGEFLGWCPGEGRN